MTRNSLSGIVLIALFTLGMTSCNDHPVTGEADLLNEKSALLQNLTYADELTDADRDGILLMREEEKMARDLYLFYYELWKTPVFTNIAESEQNHYDAVFRLIEYYQLTDPSTGIVGVFNDPALAELYQELKTKGTVSETEALKCGAYVEEVDILDLQKLIESTDNPAIQQIYGNLLRGSRNHLRAFVSLLSAAGFDYLPLLMDRDDFEAIINSPMETGNGNPQQNGRGYRGRG